MIPFISWVTRHTEIPLHLTCLGFFLVNAAIQSTSIPSTQMESPAPSAVNHQLQHGGWAMVEGKHEQLLLAEHITM